MNQELFEYMQNEHNVTLKQQDMQEIIRIVKYTPTESKGGGTFVPCDENDPQRCGSYTSNDGQSLCYVKPTPAVEPSIEKRFAVESKAGGMEEFQRYMDSEYSKLPYTKHLDDGQYNDGVQYGFEIATQHALRWLPHSPSTNTEVGSEGKWRKITLNQVRTITGLLWAEKISMSKAQELFNELSSGKRSDEDFKNHIKEIEA